MKNFVIEINDEQEKAIEMNNFAFEQHLRNYVESTLQDIVWRAKTKLLAESKKSLDEVEKSMKKE